MYEQTTSQIDLLYDDLTQIRESIDTLCGIRRRNRNRNYTEDETSDPTIISEPRRATNISPILSQPTVLPGTRTPSFTQSRPNLSQWFQNLNARSPLAGTTEGLLQSLGFGSSNFYDSVPVAPTQRQIGNATRTVEFSSIENPPNTSCPITLDGFRANTRVIQILHCGHVFDSGAFTSWFRGHTHCPVCRYDIREYTPLRSETGTQEQEPEISVEVQIDSVEEQEETPSLEEERSSSERERTTERPAQRINQEEMDRIQQMVDNLPFTEEELVNTFTNVTGNILNSLLNIPSGENPVTSDNSRYYIDASDNLVFESFMRNAFR